MLRDVSGQQPRRHNHEVVWSQFPVFVTTVDFMIRGIVWHDVVLTTCCRQTMKEIICEFECLDF